ncbi:MAG: hypothetical protein A2857_01495 [Candidatus Levybacteria bacterium RIFCSPHIGHO2_01_FULL_36_15]|nr:MAG: hypothetical protein A2857_01495 [Candidatus Levybacteria bacterium RIFCSPHIGHO2_01_FULL_36_15]OGH39277.1 MAG: hypothetical protein A2905_00235 [Candidatus Levybacteria bacterium RIFCSPLOWO2_01_FULL_36_10]
MQLTDEHKKDIERSIMECIINALNKDLISSKDLPEISSYVLPKAETITTQEEMITFLKELSVKWNIFSQVLSSENGEVRGQMESQTVDKVTDLVKSGKIDEALDLAKSVTADNQNTQQ